MFRKRTTSTPVSLAGSLYGVGISVEVADPAIVDLVMAFLPPVWAEADAAAATIAFVLARNSSGELRLEMNGEEAITGEPDRVLEVFDRYMRNHVARTAPDHVFVHAGVVALNGSALVIPGASFSGKTSLVAALVRAGATYFSDEYAVFDRTGHVLPFPKPLSIRLTRGDSRQTQHDVTELGGTAGSDPARVRVLAITQYRMGANWSPVELSPANALLEVFGHTYRGIDRPGYSLSVLRTALADAIALKGDRGEATDSVPDLMARLGTP